MEKPWVKETEKKRREKMRSERETLLFQWRENSTEAIREKKQARKIILTGEKNTAKNKKKSAPKAAPIKSKK